MARKKITPEEMQNRLLWGELQKSMALNALSLRGTAARIGVNYNTLRCGRKKDPGTFTVTDLRHMVQVFGWDARTVAAILGAAE